MLTVSRLSKQFKGQPALKEISFSIERGQRVGLAGPDGAGKTTLIRLIAGLLLPSSGHIEIDRESEVIGYMPQRFALYEDLTVLQNLTLYADLHGVAKERQEAVFAPLLDFTSLGPFLGRLAGALSGGMKQKLGLACALIHKPTLLLLDEPSVGVDPISRRELWQMVDELLSEGISILWSTAYLDEAERCDSVLLLSDGELLYDGPPQAMCERVAGRTFHLPLSTGRRHRLLELLGGNDVVDGTVDGEGLRLLMKERRGPPGAEPMAPTFEEAYVDALGGRTLRSSVLAEGREVIDGKGEPVIEVKGLSKSFGDFRAVNNLSFSVRRGEIFGLLGPNGAGKSTTFRMMCGLLRPSEGEAFIDGIELQKGSGKARAQIGYMAQKFSLYGNLSVRQNLEFFARVYGQKGGIDRMIEIFDLEPYLSSGAVELPLGFKQRLAIACATIHSPPILFLDEPTSGVDPITRREFWLHIISLVEKGVTVVVTSHFMDEAEFCDRIALIYGGNLIELGTPAELKAKSNCDRLEEAFIHLIGERR